jgi:hypothetical protein
MLSPAVLHQIRETLEERLAREDAARILLAALGTWGSGGAAPPDLAAVLRTTLRTELARHLPQREADAMLRRLEDLLDDADLPTAPRKRPDRFDPNDGASTREMPSLQGAATVLVASATDDLAVHLTVALASFTVIIRTAQTPKLVAVSRQHLNDFVVLDGNAPVTRDPKALAEAVRGFEDCLFIVWGADVPAGAAMARALETASIHPVSLSRAGGVEPLLDLIISRAPPRRRR